MSRIHKYEAQIIGERLRSEVENAFKLDDSIPDDFKLTVSLGLAVYPVDSEKIDELIRKADLALYHAKKTGKNKTCVYSPELEQATKEKVARS